MPNRSPPVLARAANFHAACLRLLPPIYCFWAILIGSLVAWVTPPWQNPDEGTQVRRAVQIARGEMLGRRLSPTDAGGIGDTGVAAAERPLAYVWANPRTTVRAAALREAAAVRWGSATLDSFPNTATYPPFLYAAPTLAAWIGRTTRLGVVATLHLMRLLNVLLAAAIGTAALATAHRTRLALAFALLLPMSAALAASAGQDALLLPLAAWAVAGIDRARNDPARPPNLLAVLAIAAALLLVSLARPPYVALALLLLALPAGSLLARCGLAATIVGATVLWAGYVAWRIGVPLGESAPGLQGTFLLHHPFGFLATAADTLAEWGHDYPPQAVGVFGWLDTPLPGAFVQAVERCFMVVLLGAAVADAPRRVAWWEGRFPLGLLAVFGGVLALFLALYVTWSPPGAALVHGIQGRYFLPLLPAVALAVPNLGRWAGVFRLPALGAVLLLAAVGPVVTITTLVDRYYLMP